MLDDSEQANNHIKCMLVIILHINGLRSNGIVNRCREKDDAFGDDDDVEELKFFDDKISFFIFRKTHIVMLGECRVPLGHIKIIKKVLMYHRQDALMWTEIFR